MGRVAILIIHAFSAKGNGRDYSHDSVGPKSERPCLHVYSLHVYPLILNTARGPAAPEPLWTAQ